MDDSKKEGEAQDKITAKMGMPVGAFIKETKQTGCVFDIGQLGYLDTAEDYLNAMYPKSLAEGIMAKKYSNTNYILINEDDYQKLTYFKFKGEVQETSDVGRKWKIQLDDYNVFLDIPGNTAYVLRKDFKDMALNTEKVQERAELGRMWNKDKKEHYTAYDWIKDNYSEKDAEAIKAVAAKDGEEPSPIPLVYKTTKAVHEEDNVKNVKIYFYRLKIKDSEFVRPVVMYDKGDRKVFQQAEPVFLDLERNEAFEYRPYYIS